MSVKMENVERLREIKDEMKELFHEAERIIRQGPSHIYEQARAYPLPHIAMALDSDHTWLGSITPTLEQVADNLEGYVEDEREEEENASES